MVSDETYREKARWELHKKVTSYIEHIQEAISHETKVVRPPTSYLWNNLNKTNKACRTQLEKLTKWSVTVSDGPCHMCVQEFNDQKHTYNSSLWTTDVVSRTCRERCIIGMIRERESEKSVLARLVDEDTFIFTYFVKLFLKTFLIHKPIKYGEFFKDLFG